MNYQEKIVSEIGLNTSKTKGSQLFLSLTKKKSNFLTQFLIQDTVAVADPSPKKSFIAIHK